MIRSLVFAALASIALATPSRAQDADLIVTNARIYTVDASRPLVDAMVVRGGRIVFTGPTMGAMTMKGPATRVLDLGGRTVIPGMIDAHVHLLGLGTALRTVDLRGTRSYDEVVARVAARAREVPRGPGSSGARGTRTTGPTPASRRTRRCRARSRAIPSS